MVDVIEIAQYIMSKDPERLLFTKNLVHRNGRDFYEGNARLNKYLHLAQNLYIAKTGQQLFNAPLYAYENGAVVPRVQENYSILYNRKFTKPLPAGITEFLDKLYTVLENASLDELIEMSHEDSEWINKHWHYHKENQKMDSLAKADEYREQYADVLKVMERM